MKPPADLPSTLVALGERFAREAGIESADFWAYIYRRKTTPADLRRVWVDAFFPLVSPDDLTARPENSTIGTMSTQEIEAPRRGRPPVIDHPLFAALAKKGVTLAEEAKAVKRSPASIRSMCYPEGDENRRPAPEALKKRWHDEYGVPLKAWK